MIEERSVAIVGAGIGGLTLALALEKHCGLKAVVYEQATRFDDNAGGAIGLYANGLRVFRDISSKLLADIQEAGFPYLQRRWMRHDGTEVACADESAMLTDLESTEAEDLQSLGVRRWKLQKILVDHCKDKCISIIFGKKLNGVIRKSPQEQPLFDNECLQQSFVLQFADGSCSEQAQLVFGADGLRSKCRELLFGAMNPLYSGVTCLMGVADMPRPFRGICFPSSATSKCHACVYPTAENEQVFQIYYPTEERPETWGPLKVEDAELECKSLAARLQDEGWHQQFIQPVLQAKNVIRVGLRARNPLDDWYRGNIILLGDAAHPPLPYIGQGAMMAIEDAGVLARLCQSQKSFLEVGRLYQEFRKPRVTSILSASKGLGKMQQARADSWINNCIHEWSIWWQVQFHGTLPALMQGVTFRYDQQLGQFLRDQQLAIDGDI